MNELPIVNRTKHTLWMQIDYTDQKLYVDSKATGGYMGTVPFPVAPGEHFILNIQTIIHGFTIKELEPE